MASTARLRNDHPSHRIDVNQRIAADLMDVIRIAPGGVAEAGSK